MRNHVWGCAAVFLLSISSSGCSSSDSSAAAAKGTQYLALGDSIAYGENGFVPFTVADRPNGDGFVGYPDLLGAQVFGGQYENLGCPGATTASYLSLEGVDNGCRKIQTEWLNTLHVQYTSTEADKADEVLGMNHVRVVTVGLGGNDLLLTLAACAEATPGDDAKTFSCALAELPKTIQAGADNLTQIFKRIHEAGFTGKLIYVNLYSTYRPADSATLAVSAWNNAMASVVADAGGTVADAFKAFADTGKAAGGDPCAAGLLIPNPVADGTPACDQHPSPKGARLLADTVKAVPGFAP